MPNQALLPESRGLYYGGAWHEAVQGSRIDVVSPTTGSIICSIADGGAVSPRT